MTSNTIGSLQTAPEAIASYNYDDIATGTGYSIFYGSRGASGANIVTVNKVYSEDIHNVVAVTLSNSFVAHFTTDFDITMNLPQYMKGELYMSFPIGVYIAGDTTDTTWYSKLEVFHVTALNAETSLGSGESRRFFHENATGAYPDSEMSQHKITISGKHFKRGEKIRFRITGYYKNTGTPAAWVGIGHDPMNRSDLTWDLDGVAANDSHQIIITDDPTIMEMHVPFRIGL